MTRNTRAGAGRPRDPLLEQRVQDAACRLYGEVGWAGFSIDAVARAAKVGKSSIYLRWPNNTSLLLDSLQAQIDVPLDVDTGSVRGDLLELTRSIFASLTGEAGNTVLRLAGEARLVPELAPRWEQFQSANVTAVRAIVRRAVKRKDLPQHTPVTLMLDALFGGLLMQCLTTPPSRTAALAKTADAYTKGLVDFVLASVAES